jgi:prophage regulatory protein
MGAKPGDLMGPWEICQRLNVSRQRFQQLARYPSFPKPFQELRGMKVWLKNDIEAWAAEHRPPRPDAD